MADKSFLLNSGYKIPAIGLGTWKIKGFENIRKAIRNAISLGYRHIDTAYKYENESDIGRVLKELFDEGVVSRQDIFVTSKLWCTQHKDPEKALCETLKRLKLDYLDLYLIHYPVTYRTNSEDVEVFGKDGFPIIEEFDAVGLWKKMEGLVNNKSTKDKIRSIGVSNFGIYNLNRLIESPEIKIKPAVNQFEVHPYLKQKELLKLCMDNGMRVIGFSSLGSSQGTSEISQEKPVVRKDEVIVDIGKKYNKSGSQVILSYLLQQGICLIPKSTDLSHLKENIELIELSKEDMKTIDGIKTTCRYVEPVYLGKDAFK